MPISSCALAQIKHVSALMGAKQQGSIIDICSVAGHRADYSSTIAHGVAKAALIHRSRCTALGVASAFGGRASLLRAGLTQMGPVSELRRDHRSQPITVKSRGL
jgi:NAD(P)-dependent dehydrogenase (short-subunit alcohol dehydrogenase family)